MVTSRTVLLKKCCSVGDGRKACALEFREALSQWFVDLRTSLEAVLWNTLFLLQAKTFYADSLQ